MEDQRVPVILDAELMTSWATSLALPGTQNKEMRFVQYSSSE